MVISDDIQIAPARMTLAAQVLVGRDQRAMMPRLFFARIRDRIDFGDKLAPVFGKAAEEQPATLVRILRFAVTTDFVSLLCFERNHRACSPQKLSLKYFSPLSHRMVTTTEPGAKVRASLKAAKTFAPELMPPSSPSSRARRRVISCAASGVTPTHKSASEGS